MLSNVAKGGEGRAARIKRGIMFICALVLFAAGIWLLVNPANTRRGALELFRDENLARSCVQFVDNVDATALVLSRLCA